jgi:hypothetical protein
MPVCPDRLCSADVDASSFDVLLALQTLRIAIHRRKGAALKFFFILVPFLFGGCFMLFKDREVMGSLPAIVAPGASALLVDDIRDAKALQVASLEMRGRGVSGAAPDESSPCQAGCARNAAQAVPRAIREGDEPWKNNASSVVGSNVRVTAASPEALG